MTTSNRDYPDAITDFFCSCGGEIIEEWSIGGPNGDLKIGGIIELLSDGTCTYDSYFGSDYEYTYYGDDIHDCSYYEYWCVNCGNVLNDEKGNKIKNRITLFRVLKTGKYDQEDLYNEISYEIRKRCRERFKQHR